TGRSYALNRSFTPRPPRGWPGRTSRGTPLIGRSRRLAPLGRGRRRRPSRSTASITVRGAWLGGDAGGLDDPGDELVVVVDSETRRIVRPPRWPGGLSRRRSGWCP